MSTKFPAAILACFSVPALLLHYPASAQVPGERESEIDPALFQALEWRNVGPFRGGRVPAVAGHPEQ